MFSFTTVLVGELSDLSGASGGFAKRLRKGISITISRKLTVPHKICNSISYITLAIVAIFDKQHLM